MSKRKQKHSSRMRNWLHDHPLLGKCGIHEKSEKAKRQKQKVKLKKEWFDQSTIDDCILMKPFAGVTKW